MIRLVVLIYFCAVFTSFGQSIGDFVIIQNPAKLIIWNKFKQPINEFERGMFAKNKPLFITKQNGVLNDGVRAYTEIEINGNKYFLLKELNGDFYEQNKAGKVEYFFKKRYYYDTIKILKEKGNLLYSVDKKRQSNIKEGETVVRIFEDGKLFYVKLEDNSYGWMQLGNVDKDYANIKKKLKVKTKITNDITKRIKERFDYLNKLNNKLYSELNNLKKRSLPPVKWNLTIAENKIIATTNHSFNKITESNKILVNKLETIILGTGLRVKLNNNNIEISE
ncbi:MAG TPA: hypothetical protein PL041_06970 [Melioribacteraceae bacterium]|nr:hypothetical protein [Melioribacteraceae bacterium]